MPDVLHMTRAQIVSHPAASDIEYRITRHQPYKASGEGPSPKIAEDGEPYPVVEMFMRDYAGELKRIARFTMEQFIELHREVVVVGRELVPTAPVADVVD